MRRAVASSTLLVMRAPGGVAAPPAPVLRALPGVREAAVLATCHRTEVYIVTDEVLWRQGFGPADLSQQSSGPADLSQQSSGIADLWRQGFNPATTERDAVGHLLRVACGLDSPILGDAQVLGQVRRAYLAALEAGTTGPLLNRLFETALQAGKRTRHLTGLGRGATTASAAAAALADRLADGLEGRRILVIGAGETGTLAARHLAHRRPASIVIANRSPDRAEALAQAIGGAAIGLDALPAALAGADIVVCATSRPGVVVTADRLAQVMASRPARPLIAIDLAAPHDVDPACAAIPGVVLKDLAAVEHEAERDRTARAAAVPAAEAIVEEQLARFEEWRHRREIFLTRDAAGLRKHEGHGGLHEGHDAGLAIQA